MKRFGPRMRRALRALRAAPPAARVAALALALAIVWAAANAMVQVWRKPTEVLFPVGQALVKSPASTWREYGALFREHSTPMISAELLAALAQVEAAGNPATWEQALNMVRRGGVVNFFSGLPTGTRVEIEPSAIHYSEIKIISPFHHTPRFIREALEAIRRGDVSAQEFVTEDIRLEDLPEAFARMKSRSGEIKLAVRP